MLSKTPEAFLRQLERFHLELLPQETEFLHWILQNIVYHLLNLELFHTHKILLNFIQNLSSANHREIFSGSIIEGLLIYITRSINKIMNDKIFDYSKNIITFLFGAIQSLSEIQIQLFLEKVPDKLYIHMIVLFSMQEVLDIEVILITKFKFIFFCIIDPF